MIFVRVEFEFVLNGRLIGEVNVDFKIYFDVVEVMFRYKKNMRKYMDMYFLKFVKNWNLVIYKSFLFVDDLGFKNKRL